LTVPEPVGEPQLDTEPLVVKYLPELPVWVGRILSTSLATPAEMAVPFPFRIPVIVVESVIAGVVVGVATVPAKPLAETTDTVVTVPPPATAVSVKRRPVTGSILKGSTAVASTLD
jgi:hypothetical protein